MNGDVIVVIPARGGSKRVPRKNIRSLGGKPLLAYAIENARDAGFVEATLVSTEDAEIAAVARSWGAQVVDRPVDLAADATSTEAVLIHAIDQAARNGWHPDWVVTLPPTSPLRRAETVGAFVSIARSNRADCCLSLTETRADFWRADDGGTLVRLFPNAPRRQQDRSPLYEENSAIYVTRIEALRRTGSILGSSQAGIAIDPTEGFDINTEHDLALAQALIDAGLSPTSCRLIS